MWENIEILDLSQKKREETIIRTKLSYCKFFTENLLSTEMKKPQKLMNEPAYLELSVLDLGKTVMYEFWYDDLKPKYGENAKLCFIYTDSFIVHVKTIDIYKDIAEDVDTRSDTSNFQIDRPLPIEKN